MTLLWDKNRSLSSSEIKDHFKSANFKSWKIQTINTYLSRMIKKGVILTDSDNKYLYHAAISQKQYEQKLAEDILDDFFNGSSSKFLSALSGCEKLNKEEIEKIKKLLE